MVNNNTESTYQGIDQDAIANIEAHNADLEKGLLDDYMEKFVGYLHGEIVMDDGEIVHADSYNGLVLAVYNLTAETNLLVKEVGAPRKVHRFLPPRTR